MVWYIVGRVNISITIFGDYKQNDIYMAVLNGLMVYSGLNHETVGPPYFVLCKGMHKWVADNIKDVVK